MPLDKTSLSYRYARMFHSIHYMKVETPGQIFSASIITSFILFWFAIVQTILGKMIINMMGVTLPTSHTAQVFISLVVGGITIGLLYAIYRILRIVFRKTETK